MLVSHRKKFIFTKTRKTAGTSVEIYFEKYCLPEGDWEFRHFRDEYQGRSGIVGYRGYNPASATYVNHMSAAQIREKVGAEIWNGYFKFTVIRNPFDRLISAFYHLEKSGNAEKYRDDKRSDVQQFRQWIAEGGNSIDHPAWLIDGQVCMDYFIRYETLESGIRQICERLEIPFDLSGLPRLKSEYRDRRYGISQFYDSETRRIVEDLYQLENRIFGYTLPEESAL